jgi:hypothetical protein
MAKTIADLCPTEYGLLSVAPPGHAFDKTKRIKRWADPSALQSPDDMVVYRVFVKLDLSGKPVWKNIFLTPAEASAYNIPPTGPLDTSSVSGSVPECPIPARQLADDEVIVNVPGPFGGLYQVVTTADLQAAEVGFTQGDRDLLKKIAAKLGV